MKPRCTVSSQLGLGLARSIVHDQPHALTIYTTTTSHLSIPLVLILLDIYRDKFALAWPPSGRSRAYITTHICYLPVPSHPSYFRAGLQTLDRTVQSLTDHPLSVLLLCFLAVSPCPGSCTRCLAAIWTVRSLLCVTPRRYSSRIEVTTC